MQRTLVAETKWRKWLTSLLLLMETSSISLELKSFLILSYMVWAEKQQLRYLFFIILTALVIDRALLWTNATTLSFKVQSSIEILRPFVRFCAVWLFFIFYVERVYVSLNIQFWLMKCNVIVIYDSWEQDVQQSVDKFTNVSLLSSICILDFISVHNNPILFKIVSEDCTLHLTNFQCWFSQRRRICMRTILFCIFDLFLRWPS